MLFPLFLLSALLLGILTGLTAEILRSRQQEAALQGRLSEEPIRIFGQETPSGPRDAIESDLPAEMKAEEESEASEENGEEERESAQRKELPYLIAIDAGHQGKGNNAKEPIGPGASEMKSKVSSGTQGRFTGVPEYKLTLEIALKLQKELESRGYRVVMTRTTHEVDISNSERAATANENHADAFVRIHADGSENPSDKGAMTICGTADNPYCSEIYEESRLLSECILDAYVEETGAVRRKIWETDSMSGINWSRVPVTILEMGYMTNEEEDRKMQTEEYQEKMVTGIANGLDSFFAQKKENLSLPEADGEG